MVVLRRLQWRDSAVHSCCRSATSWPPLMARSEDELMGSTRGFARKSSAGFTLIEVMIVVAIIGILAAIAYPSYQDHVRKSRRADAQTALLELAQFMERHYTTNGRYLTSANAAPALPFSEAPKDGTTKF